MRCITERVRVPNNAIIDVVRMKKNGSAEIIAREQHYKNVANSIRFLLLFLSHSAIRSAKLLQIHLICKLIYSPSVYLGVADEQRKCDF